MKRVSRWIELAVGAIPAFANDGTLDHAELDRLLGLALEDGVVDADERRVLRGILARLDPAGLPRAMATRVRDLLTSLELEDESASSLEGVAA